MRAPEFWVPLLALCFAIPAALARPEVASGGDGVAYLLAARYHPLLDSFDNPSHGWGYPAAIKLLAILVGDLHRASVLLSLGALVVYTVLAVRLGRAFLPSRWIWPFGILLALQPTLLDLGSETASDMLFAALVAGSIWLLVANRGTWADAVAGVLAASAFFVRGNTIALLIAAVLWLMVNRSWGRLASFVAGAAVVTGCAAAAAAIGHVPMSKVFRSGAGELAFVILDRSDNWVERLGYEELYPSYLPLVKSHTPALLRAAAKTVVHVHDWWLLPAFSLLGFLVIPGLLHSGPRQKQGQLGLVLLVGAIQATYLWSGKFQEVRHLIASLPLLLAFAFLGTMTLPRRRHLIGRAVPVRELVLLGLAVVTLATYLWEDRKLVQRVTDDERAMHQAGLWLRSRVPHHNHQAAVAASRLNIAYHANAWPVSPIDVFEKRTPTRDSLAAELRGAGTRWFAWIDAHSRYEYPELAWLSTAGDFPGARLSYRHNGVSIWQLDDAPEISRKLASGPADPG